ncbi:MAG: hypothetical protein AAFZ63_25440 [Bacteroidota bacterium]
MENILNPIIEVYGTYGATAVETNGQYIENAFANNGGVDLMQDSRYPLLKEFVKQVQEDIEYYTADNNLDKDKVIACLQLVLWYAESPNYLVRISHDDYKFKLEGCRRIMLKNFARWGINEARLIQHFEFWFPKLRDWNFYFISYTNKGAYELNNAYQDLFQQYDDTLDAADRIMGHSNNFSKLLHLYFEKENIRRGFFDKDNLRDGDDFAQEIDEHLKNSFVLIQVMTRQAFWNVQPNWPFKEYRRFLELNQEIINENEAYRPILEKRFRFIACSENVNSVYPAGGVPIWLHRWRDHFEDIQHGPLITPEITKQQLDQLLYQLCENVIQFIKKDVITTIPAD